MAISETAALLVDTGDGTDAVVAAGIAGSLHGHIRSAQVEVNKIGTPAGASVSADIAAVKTDTAALLVDTGDGTDASVAPGVAGSLHAHIREAQTQADTIQTEVDKIGVNSEAATDPSAASGTLFSKIRGAGDNLDTLITNTTKPAADSTANVVPADVTGDKTDAVLTAIGTTKSILAYAKTALQNVGFLADAAQTTVGTTFSLMSYIKSLVNTVGYWKKSGNTSYSHANDALEQQVFAITGITTPTQVEGSLDFVNFVGTGTFTIRFYTKVDGTNYRASNPPVTWTVANDGANDEIGFSRTVSNDFKVTVQTSIADGGARTVPYNYNYRVMT